MHDLIGTLVRVASKVTEGLGEWFRISSSGTNTRESFSPVPPASRRWFRRIVLVYVIRLMIHDSG